MATTEVTPPLPPGFKLDEVPPLPAGFSLDAEHASEEMSPQLEKALAMGSRPGKTFPQYAGQALKEMAIPTALAALGTAAGGLPGAMIGSGHGEALNQKLGVYGDRSVMPGVDQYDAKRIAIATAAPAIIPTVMKGVDLLKRAGETVASKLSPTSLSNAWLREKIGPYTDSVATKLEAPSPLTNYPQTAAEKLAGTDAGSVIQGHQGMVAQTPGGISTEFAKLKKFQDLALEEGALRRNAVTTPLREQALNEANAHFGVKAADVQKALNWQLNAPELAGSPLSRKALESIKAHLGDMTDEYGRIDARSLYQFKKEGIDQVIDAAVEKSNPKFAEKFRAKELTGIKQAIDTALDKASGGKWTPYLSEYSQRSKVLDALAEARDAMYKPIQKTDLRGGMDIAPSAASAILPPWLSRPVTTTKWLAERIASHMEPKIDRYMATMYQHPDQLAQVLRGGGNVPSRYQQIVQQLLQQQAPYAAGASTQLQQHP